MTEHGVDATPMADPSPTARGLQLVTGAAGFVGRHLVEHLVARGIRVRAMVRREAQAASLRDLVEDVVVADLQRPETLPAAVAGVTGVHHVAALFRQQGVPDGAFHEINVDGVRHMLDAAIEAGVSRFVHCSTNGVHSDIDHPPADETYPFNPGDIYQETKLAGERIAMEYMAGGRISGVVLRPTMIYGPGDTRTAKLFKMVDRGKFFYVGRGDALTHWVDVRDLARAFELAMEAHDVNGEAFLIGGDAYHPLRENVQVIAAQLGVKEPRLHLPVGPVMAMAHVVEGVCRPFGIEPPLFPRRVSFFLKNRAYDIGKARRMLGYAPRQNFEGEVADIISSYRESGILAPAGGAEP